MEYRVPLELLEALEDEVKREVGKGCKSDTALFSTRRQGSCPGRGGAHRHGKPLALQSRRSRRWEAVRTPGQSGPLRCTVSALQRQCRPREAHETCSRGSAAPPLSGGA